MTTRTLPLLVLDVDGPLNPYAAKPEKRPAGYETRRWKHVTKTSFGSSYYRKLPRVWLNPEHGKLLEVMAAELVWGTSWNRLANEYIGPELGLPELPVIDVGDPPAEEQPGGLHWKVPALAAYEPDRPMLWIDDECTTEDGAALDSLRIGESAVYRVDPAVGLKPSDFVKIQVILVKMAKMMAQLGP